MGTLNPTHSLTCFLSSLIFNKAIFVKSRLALCLVLVNVDGELLDYEHDNNWRVTDIHQYYKRVKCEKPLAAWLNISWELCTVICCFASSTGPSLMQWLAFGLLELEGCLVWGHVSLCLCTRHLTDWQLISMAGGRYFTSHSICVMAYCSLSWILEQATACFSFVLWGYWRQRADERLCDPPQRWIQEPLVVTGQR